MKIIYWLITILILGLGINAQVEMKYDRYKDETTFVVKLLDTKMDVNYNSTTWTLQSAFPGEKPPAQPTIRMSMTVSGKDWKFGNERDLTMRSIIDGERVTLGKFERVYFNVYRGATMEIAAMILPMENLRKLADAKKVEVQIAGEELVLDGYQISKFHSFLHFISPPK